MNAEGCHESSLAELALADEELGSAESLLQAGFERVSLTRSYFAVFHAARAHLYASGFEPRSHAGVHHLFNLHFVKTERFEPGASRLLARLQKYREEADYSNAFVVDSDGAREELEAARAFVETVRGQMKSDRRGPAVSRRCGGRGGRPAPGSSENTCR